MKILIIGADRGLGEVLGEMAVREGHTVVAGYYDLNGYLKHDDDGILRLQMDVTDENQLKAAAESVINRVGELDAVVCVAGVLLKSDRTDSILTESLSDISRHIEVNAIGLLNAFRTLYPVMKKGSTFYAVTSEAGSFTLAGTLFPAYSVSKTAANKVVQVIRLTLEERQDDKVDVIAVHPGRMNTEMGRTTAQIEPEESAEGFLKLISGEIPVNSAEHWFIDYLGRPMPV